MSVVPYTLRWGAPDPTPTRRGHAIHGRRLGLETLASRAPAPAFEVAEGTSS